MVGRFDPFQRATDVLTNPAPVNVKVNAGPPALALFGLRLSNVGAGGTGCVMLKVSGLEAPPPAPALNAVICAVPATAKSAAVMVAINCVGEITVVARLAPFQRAAVVALKFTPLTVTVKPGVPAGAELGARLVSVGTLVCASTNVLVPTSTSHKQTHKMHLLKGLLQKISN